MIDHNSFSKYWRLVWCKDLFKFWMLTLGGRVWCHFLHLTWWINNGVGGSFANHKFSLNFVLCTWIRQEHLIWPEMWLYKKLEDPSNWKIGLESIFCKKCVWQLKRKVCLAIGLVMHHRGGAVFSKRENTAEHGNNEVNTDHLDFIRIIIVILKIKLQNPAQNFLRQYGFSMGIFYLIARTLLPCQPRYHINPPLPTSNSFCICIFFTF